MFIKKIEAAFFYMGKFIQSNVIEGPCDNSNGICISGSNLQSHAHRCLTDSPDEAGNTQ